VAAGDAGQHNVITDRDDVHPVHRRIAGWPVRRSQRGNFVMTRIPVGAPSRSVTALGWAFIVLGSLVPAALVLPQVRASAWMLVGLAALAVLLAAVGVGLLQRLDWARRAFIVLLGSTVGLLGLAVWPQLLWLLSAASIGIPLAALVTSLGLCAVSAWAIRRLTSARVRREFA
jgi:hypothetical protein